MLIEKYPRINVTQTRLKEVIEKNKLKLLNKNHINSIKLNNNKNGDGTKNDDKKNKNSINKLSERKVNNNIIANKRNIKNPRKKINKFIDKNIMYKILTKNPNEIINKTRKNFDKNQSTKSKNNNDSQINIDNKLIKKYVKKGSFSISPKALKNIESSFEIYPISIIENKLSPIKPNNHFNSLDEINVEESEMILTKDDIIVSPKTIKNFKMNETSKILPKQMKKIINKEDSKDVNNIDENYKRNIEALTINSEIDDPFLTFPPIFNSINDTDTDDALKTFDYTLCKEKKELSLTEEDDEILI